MPDDNKIPLEPWVSDYIDKTGQVPTMHIFLNPHETGNPESKPANQAPPSAYPDIEADHTQQKVQDQHIATGVFSPEDAKPEDLEAAQTAQAFGWSTDTELKLAQAHKLVNQAGEAMSGAVPSSMQEVTEHPIVSALKTAGFAIDPVGAMGATIGGQATDALVDKYVPQATNPMLHPVLKTASGLIGGILGGGVAGGAKKAVTSSIVDEAGNPMVAASETLSPETIAEQTRSPQAQLESYSKALQSHLENPNDEEFRNLKPGTILNAEDTANLNIKTNTRIDNLTKLAKAYMATTTPEEKEQVLNMFKQEMVPTAQIIKSGLGVAAEHGRALALHNTDWSAAKDVGALLAGKPDQDWDSFIRAMSTMESNEDTVGKMGGEVSSQIGFNFGGKTLQGGGRLDPAALEETAAKRAAKIQAVKDYLTGNKENDLGEIERRTGETGQINLSLGGQTQYEQVQKALKFEGLSEGQRSVLEDSLVAMKEAASARRTVQLKKAQDIINSITSGKGNDLAEIERRTSQEGQINLSLGNQTQYEQAQHALQYNKLSAGERSVLEAGLAAMREKAALDKVARVTKLNNLIASITQKPGDPVVLQNLEHNLTESGQQLLDLGLPIGSGQQLLNLIGKVATSQGSTAPDWSQNKDAMLAADRAYSALNNTRFNRSKAMIGQWLSGANSAAYKILINAQLMNPRIAAEKILTDVIYQPYNITMQAIATAARFKSLSAGAKVWTGAMQANYEALSDAWKFAKATVKSGAPEFEKSIGNVNDPRIFAEDYGNTVPGKTANWLSSAFGIGTRTVVGADQFAKTTAYRAELQTQAFYRAMQDAESMGLSGAQAYRQALVQSKAYIETMPEWLSKSATGNMAKDTFTDEDAYTQGAKQVTDAIPVLKLVAPFLRTPINLLENGMLSTPAAPLTAKFWQGMNEGGLARDTALTKLAVGSSLWGWMVHEAAKGNIIPSAPSDPSMRETFNKQFGDGEAVRIGDSYVSVKHMGPIGDMLIHAANYAHYAAQMPANDMMGYGTAGVKAMAKIASNAPLLEPLMNTMSALGEGLKSEETGKGVGKPLAKLGGRIAASFIPAPLKIAADAAFGYTRDTNNAWDAIKNRLPGNGMPPHLDQWADPQFLSPGAGPNDEGPAWYESVLNSISPLPIYHGRELDAVEKEQQRVGFKASRVPDSLYASDPRLPIPIDPETRHRWGILAGKELKLRPILGAGGPMNQHDNIETMINNKNYQDIATQYRDPEIAKAKQAQEIEKIHRMYMEQARKQLLNERLDLRAMAVRRQALETPRAGAVNVGAN